MARLRRADQIAIHSFSNQMKLSASLVAPYLRARPLEPRHASVRAAGLEFLERAAHLAVSARPIWSSGPDILTRVDEEIVRIWSMHVTRVHLGIVSARKVGFVAVVL